MAQMTSSAESDKLPVIDISALYGESEESMREIGRQLGDAARTSGFFYIFGHGVPHELIDEM